MADIKKRKLTLAELAKKAARKNGKKFTSEDEEEEEESRYDKDGNLLPCYGMFAILKALE